MVAANQSLSDSDKSIDFTKIIQGHVGPNTKQIFSVERTRYRRCKRLNIESVEHIVRDQFGNLYVVFLAPLMDGEVWAHVEWVGAEKWSDLGKQIVLVREWKVFGQFDDDLLSVIQDRAFAAFGKENLAYLKGAHAAKKAVIHAKQSE